MDPRMSGGAFGPCPRVTAIVPVRNRADLLPRAVHSILNQSQGVLEAIVVDDGSTDDTWVVATTLASADSRVVPLRNQGRTGAQGARNTGIRAARGEWVAFLDSDDYWLPESVKARVTTAAARQVEVVHSNCLVNHPGQPAAPWVLPGLSGNVRQALLGTPSIVFPGLLVTRHALETIGLLDETIVAYQEWDTAIRLAERFDFAFVEEPTFVWDRTCAGTISEDRSRDAAGYAQVVDKHSKRILEVLGSQGLAKHYVLLTGMFSRAGNLHGVHWSVRRLAACNPTWSQLATAGSSVIAPWLDRALAPARRRLGPRWRHWKNAKALL